MHHAPALIHAHLQFVNDAAMPFLTWCGHGHEWATAIALAWVIILLFWPLISAAAVGGLYIAWVEHQERAALRRRSWAHLRLRR